MGFPVVPILPEGEIATRPRRNSVYDTEAYNDAVAAPSKLTLFRNFQDFQEASVSLNPKVLGRDTNLSGPGGSLGKGDVLHWYSVTLPWSARGGNLSNAANVVFFEEVVRLRMMSWFTFRFGSTPYIQCQCDEIPQGVGVYQVMTTHPTTTVFPAANTKLCKQNAYDVTVRGQPSTITDLETFAVDIEKVTGAPFAISPTIETFVTCHLNGIYLKGIRG